MAEKITDPLEKFLSENALPEFDEEEIAEPEAGEEEEVQEPVAKEKEPTEPTKEPPSEDGIDIEELKRKAQEWDSFEDRFSRDPRTFAKAILDALSDEDRKAVLEQDEKKGGSDDEDIEPLSRIEEDYMKNRSKWDKGLETISQYQQSHASIILDLLVDREILRGQVEALLTSANLQIPAADREAIRNALLSGKKVDYAEIAKKSVVGRRPRPTTPPGENSGVSISQGESMASIMRKLRAMETET